MNKGFEIETKDFQRNIKINPEQLREDVITEREEKGKAFNDYLKKIGEDQENKRKLYADLLEEGYAKRREQEKAEAVLKAEAEAAESIANAENYGKDKIREALRKTLKGETPEEDQTRKDIEKLKEGYGEGAKRKAQRELLKGLLGK